MLRTVQNRHGLPSGSPLAGSPLLASLAQASSEDDAQLERQAEKALQWKVGAQAHVIIGRCNNSGRVQRAWNRPIEVPPRQGAACT